MLSVLLLLLLFSVVVLLLLLVVVLLLVLGGEREGSREGESHALSSLRTPSSSSSSAVHSLSIAANAILAASSLPP